jgi:hypothetical protein
VHFFLSLKKLRYFGVEKRKKNLEFVSKVFFCDLIWLLLEPPTAAGRRPGVRPNFWTFSFG